MGSCAKQKKIGFFYLLSILASASNADGAHDRNRTGDLVLTKDVLYRLSYMGAPINLQS